MTITDTQRAAIATYLETHHLPSGLGTREEPCSVAAINLALTGELTDRIPDCMSAVIGHWVIVVQDAMGDTLRNSAAWKDLLPFAAGTGRDHEAERLALILDWLRKTVLPVGQSLADRSVYSDAWLRMCTKRTAEAARLASSAIDATDAIEATEAAAYAAGATGAAYAAYAACAAYAVTSDHAWDGFAPCALLAALIAVGQ